MRMSLVCGFLVDLIGIEPMTSSMPWNDKIGVLLTVKDLWAGKVVQNGPIVAKCYQFATKILTEQGRLSRGGPARFLLSLPTFTSLCGALTFLGGKAPYLTLGGKAPKLDLGGKAPNGLISNEHGNNCPHAPSTRELHSRKAAKTRLVAGGARPKNRRAPENAFGH